MPPPTSEDLRRVSPLCARKQQNMNAERRRLGAFLVSITDEDMSMVTDGAVGRGWTYSLVPVYQVTCPRAMSSMSMGGAPRIIKMFLSFMRI